MDLSALRQQVMFQIGGDAGDVQDYLPYLTDYLNEGYDRLVMAAFGRHVCTEEEEYQPLFHDRSQHGRTVPLPTGPPGSSAAMATRSARTGATPSARPLRMWKAACAARMAVRIFAIFPFDQMKGVMA